MRTNHGGVVIAASNDFRLRNVNTGGRRSSFEHVCCQITSCDASCAALLIYRPGSATITGTFFDELSDILHNLATLNVPLIVAGDVNIPLQTVANPNSRRFVDLLATFGLSSRVHGPTHDCGG